jgi:hypothetical protein
MMKGQVAVTEYMVLVLMIAIISFLVVVLIFGFELFSTGSQQSVGREKTTMFLMKSFTSSNILTDLRYQKGSVFDDSKLTIASCNDLVTLFGYDFYAEIRVLEDKAVCDDLYWYQQPQCIRDLEAKENIQCSDAVYPECSTWKFCDKEQRMTYRSIPVNVYRKMNGTVALGVLTVGVPTGD